MNKIGKFWTDAVAYVALILGAGVSIAGNVADTFRTRGQDTDSLDIFLASFWPAVVVLTVHLFVNARWRGLSWPMQTLRWLGCLSIGAMAMRVSWVHLNDLMASRGQKADVAILGPLAIDFLAIMATALILAGHGQKLDIDLDSTLAKWVNPGQVANRMGNVLDTLASQDAHMSNESLGVQMADIPSAFKVIPTQDPEADLFARLERQFSSADAPVSPAPVSTVVPEPAVSGRQKRLTPADSLEASGLALAGRRSGLGAGEISELLAGWYSVSARTIRRQGWWVEAMAGKLDSNAA